MKYPQKNGFSLIELMVAMAMASIVGVAIASTYTVQVRGKNTQDALTDMNQTARAVLEIMTSEIRMAGLDPEESAPAGVRLISVADVGELVFALDRRSNAGTVALNAPDGDFCDPSEQIRYHLTNDGDDDGVNEVIATGTECHLGRETGTGLIPGLGCGGGTNGLQPLARNVDVLNFVYLDQNGAVLATPVANTDNIRAIQVTIVARAGTESRGFFYDYTDNNAYFNLQNQQILAAQGDGFRRLRLATTIACRNVGL